MQEKWVDIKNYDGLYQVSNFGNVRSLDRYSKNNFKTMHLKGRAIKRGIDKKGYCRICLSSSGNCSTYKIHRLVAQAFIPNPLNLLEINHLSGNKQDNSTTNLEWSGRKENIQHAIKNNLYKHTPIKLSNEDVQAIRNMYAAGSKSLGSNALSKMFGVSAPYIWRIVTNEKRIVAES